MPLITIPSKAHDKAVKLAKTLADAERSSPDMVDLHTSEINGFFDGLRCCLPSEAVGMIVIAYDDALEKFRKG